MNYPTGTAPGIDGQLQFFWQLMPICRKLLHATVFKTQIRLRIVG